MIIMLFKRKKIVAQVISSSIACMYDTVHCKLTPLCILANFQISERGTNERKLMFKKRGTFLHFLYFTHCT